MPEVIFEDKKSKLVIQRSSSFTPQFVEFLEGIVWGSGGVQYSIHNVAERLNRLKAPHFLSLMVNGQLVAATILNHKILRLAGKTYPAIYSFGFSVDARKRGLGYGTLIAAERLRYSLSKIGEKGLYYGYIEATNTSSLKTNTKVGSDSIGQYHVLVISRLRPRDNARFQRSKEIRRDQLVNLLYDQYESHALVDLDQSVETENYYTLEQGDEILIGLQCEKHQWTVRHLPGVTGQLMVEILPHIPILQRLFPERKLQYLRFGNIYAKKGREEEIFNLMEALLARHQLNFGMIYMDKRSPIYQQLKSVGKFGVFHPLIDVPVHVMAFFKGFSEKEIADIRQQPLFISMMDPA